MSVVVERRRTGPTPQARPFPIEPLLADRGGCVTMLAATVGVPRRNVQRKRQSGLTVDEADRWAMACGLHPIEAWGDECVQS